MEFCDKIAPSFYKCLADIEKHKYTHYWLKGGRSSTKSAFISLVIILNMMRQANTHAIVFRKVADTLRDSVYEQLQWAINELEVNQYFTCRVSPMSITCVNGNKILFRGLDDPLKLKSIKANKGYFAYIWFEELAEFHSMEEVRTVLQSLMRGGNKFWCFYSYNPPKSINSWVNTEVSTPRADRGVYHSTYLQVPKEWLNEAFIVEAEHLKAVNNERYRHEYLGEVTGTGGEIFNNVKALDITDDMIKSFDNIKAGLDFGYSIDPLAYVEYHKDKTRKVLYVYHEYYGLKVSNEKIAEHIKGRKLSNAVIADSADPKSIAEIRAKGVRIIGCTKNKNSRDRTMKHLSEIIETIYIDPKRCPNTYREFTSYELARDRHGNFKSAYPDGDDHTIDALRYGEDEINFTRMNTKRGNIY